MMNQESEQDFPPPQQEIPPANGGPDSVVPLLLLNGGGGFTVLQLPQPPIADSAIKPPLRKCTSCDFGSAKKRSPPPSFLSSLHEPCSKRPAISSPDPTPTPTPTPPSSSERKRQRSLLPLRRSLSDFPCSPVGGVDFPNPAAAASASAMLKNPLSPSQMLPGNSKISRMTTMVPGQHRSPSNPSSSSDYETPPVNTTPPRPPPSSAERKRQRDPLRRSLSDFSCSPVGGAYYYQDFTNPVAAAALFKNQSSPCLHRSQASNPSSSSEGYEQQDVNTTPPRPRPPPSVAVRPQMFDHHESPNSKKLMSELKVKVEELMQAVCEPHEQEDDDDDDDDVNINCINKEKSEMMNQHQNENDGGHNDSDSVWVKQTEGGLILHFNCPCGEGYEVFLRGDKCYYRLA